MSVFLGNNVVNITRDIPCGTIKFTQPGYVVQAKKVEVTNFTEMSKKFYEKHPEFIEISADNRSNGMVIAGGALVSTMLDIPIKDIANLKFDPDDRKLYYKIWYRQE